MRRRELNPPLLNDISLRDRELAQQLRESAPPKTFLQEPSKLHRKQNASEVNNKENGAQKALFDNNWVKAFELKPKEEGTPSIYYEQSSMPSIVNSSSVTWTSV